jgi:HAD superfamily hydrolase (TIGR01509 family)
MGSDKLIPQLIGHAHDAAAERKKEIFRRKYLPQLKATPGARELVAALSRRTVALAVASSAGEDELAALLAAAGVADLLRRTTSADDAEHSKPDPDIVQAALKKIALPPQDCVLVGDTPYDAQAARSAGVAFIGLRCGGWSENDLQPAAGIVHDPAELLRRIDHIL